MGEDTKESSFIYKKLSIDCYICLLHWLQVCRKIKSNPGAYLYLMTYDDVACQCQDMPILQYIPLSTIIGPNRNHAEIQVTCFLMHVIDSVGIYMWLCQGSSNIRVQVCRSGVGVHSCACVCVCACVRTRACACVSLDQPYVIEPKRLTVHGAMRVPLRHCLEEAVE